MIAMTVLSVALLSVFSYQFTLDSMRTSSLSRAMQTIAVNNMVNLLDGTNWDELGRAQRPWSLSRIRNGGSTTLAPLTLADLLSMNVVSSETGLFAGARAADASSGFLRFYVEYYRSTSNLDSSFTSIGTQPGLLDSASTSPADFRADFTANAASCRIVPDPTTGLSNANLITPGNPLMMRVLVANVDPANGSERLVGEFFLGTGTAPQ